MAAHLPPAADDAVNFAKHPWVAAVAAEEPAVLERLGRMAPDGIPGYAEWRDVENLKPMPEELARRVTAHCEPFAADFAALAEAADRPQWRAELAFSGGFQMPESGLGKFNPCLKAIAARAAAALAVGDEDTFTNQLVLLLDIGCRMRSTHLLLGTVAGCGFELEAYRQIFDLAPGGLRQNANRTRLVEAINRRSRPPGEEMATVFRFERAMALNLIDSIETGAADFPPAAYFSIPASRRVFLARNRLALCEDSQRELLAPGERLTTVLKLDDLTRYDELTRRRFKKASAFEAVAAGLSMATGGIAEGVWHTEEKRQSARQALQGGL